MVLQLGFAEFQDDMGVRVRMKVGDGRIELLFLLPQAVALSG